MPLPLIPTEERSDHPYSTSPQPPALPRVLSKSDPFSKMDGTLQTPYAQFSFIILISKYLGRVPALASAMILVPANTLFYLPLLLIPSFIQTTALSSNLEENWHSVCVGGSPASTWMPYGSGQH